MNNVDSQRCFESKRATVFIAAAVLLVLHGVLAGPVQAGDRLALLVGCSQYEYREDWRLPGAANDIQAFHKLLIDRFEFAEEEITVLAGWPDDETVRPTYANIVAGFERLIARASQGSQVFIVLSGHGLQVPLPAGQTDLLDKSNPEPDGLDESFLAADYRPLENYIRDNDIGRWLSQLRDEKQAHVWIVFDSCFSGSLTRGSTTGAASEVSRALDPITAGIDPELLKRSAALSRHPHSSDQSELDCQAPQQAQGAGSLVAFYAAQAFQTAPEVVRPIGADPADSANRHGLLSYHLVGLLRERASHWTYADLGRAVATRFQADGRRRPTPYWEGDLDREVFGLQQWPASRPLYINRTDDQVRLLGGALAGATDNTIVAAFAPEDKEFRRPLGYLRVSRSTPTAAEVEPVAFGDSPPVDLSQIPDNSLCRVVAQELGNSRILLRLISSPDGADGDRGDGRGAELAASLAQALRDEAAKPTAVFRIVDHAVEASWDLVVLSPAAAKQQLSLTAAGPVGVLLPTDAERFWRQESATPVQRRSGAETETEAEAAIPKSDVLTTIPYAEFDQQLLADPEKCAGRVAAELQKILVWRNLWRLAGAYSEPSPYVSRQQISLKVAKIEGQQDQSAGQPLRSSRVQRGDSLVVRVVNTGYQPHWFSVFYLSGRLGIQHVRSGAIAGRDSRNLNQKQVQQEVLRFRIDDDSVGTNGFITIAVAQRDQTTEPDFRYLMQPRFGIPRTRSGYAVPRPATPFEELLVNSLSGRESLRGTRSLEEPEVASWSWGTPPIRP